MGGGAGGGVAIRGHARDSVVGAALSGRLRGKEGLAVLAGCMSFDMLNASFGTQLKSAAMRASVGKTIHTVGETVASLECTATRCQDYLTLLL
eukprot:COSAG01_NODE_59932_length_297_cov_1.030303_1_plen_92_part_10